jgi:hypothetical protein
MNVKTATPETELTTAAAPAWGGWDSSAFAGEAMSAWACAWSAWSDYVFRLITSTGPLAVIDAHTRLMADSLDVCSRAAATRLQDAGIPAPLLNDA